MGDLLVQIRQHVAVNDSLRAECLRLNGMLTQAMLHGISARTKLEEATQRVKELADDNATLRKRNSFLEPKYEHVQATPPSSSTPSSESNTTSGFIDQN